MRELKSRIRNSKLLKYALTLTLGLFLGGLLHAQEALNNPLDNADKGLIYTKKQQEKLTERLTEFWTNKQTSEKTVEWNNKLTDAKTKECNDKFAKALTTTWNEKLTEELLSNIEEKLTINLKKKWDPILNEKYPNSAQFYRQ